MIFIFFLKKKNFSLCLHRSHTANLTIAHSATHTTRQRPKSPPFTLKSWDHGSCQARHEQKSLWWRLVIQSIIGIGIIARMHFGCQSSIWYVDWTTKCKSLRIYLIVVSNYHQQIHIFVWGVDCYLNKTHKSTQKERERERENPYICLRCWLLLFWIFLGMLQLGSGRNSPQNDFFSF